MDRDDSLRASLRQLPAPDVSPDLLDRIVRSRVRGVRVSLSSRRWTVPWGRIAAAAVVILLAGGSWMAAVKLAEFGSSGAVREPLDQLLRGTARWRSNPEATESRKTPLPEYKLITSDDLDASRLVEGTWRYTVETTTDDLLTERSDNLVIRLTRANFRGRPAWMVNTGRQIAVQWDRFADTTYLDPTSLRPQQVVAYANRGRTRFLQTFPADSGLESVEMTGPIQRSWHGEVVLPFSPNVLFVSDWSMARLVPVLAAIPFSRLWRGSLYQIAFLSQAGIKGIAPMDLKVMGTDRVPVPAGVYDCWRVEIDSHFGDGERATLWISRDKGWLIQKQTRAGEFVVTTQLQSYEPGS